MIGEIDRLLFVALQCSAAIVISGVLCCEIVARWPDPIAPQSIGDAADKSAINSDITDIFR
jgi:hypothetical protein